MFCLSLDALKLGVRLGFGAAHCLTGGLLGDASVMAKVAGCRLSVKILGAVAVVAGAPLANAAAWDSWATAASRRSTKPS